MKSSDITKFHETAAFIFNLFTANLFTANLSTLSLFAFDLFAFDLFAFDSFTFQIACFRHPKHKLLSLTTPTVLWELFLYGSCYSVDVNVCYISIFFLLCRFSC